MFAPEGSALPAAIKSVAGHPGEHRLLDPRIATGFATRHDEVLGSPGVTPILEGGVRFDEQGHGWATPTVVTVSLENFRAGHDALVEESFGPLSIIVETPVGTDLAALMPEFYEGNLTGTLHLGAQHPHEPIDDGCGRATGTGFGHESPGRQGALQRLAHRCCRDPGAAARRTLACHDQ